MYAAYTFRMVASLTSREARENFAKVLDSARHGEPTIITNHGQRVAVVVPIDMYDEIERMEEAALLKIVNDRRAAVAAGEPTYSLDEVVAETLARTE